jgi:uncharacterized membrane protein
VEDLQPQPANAKSSPTPTITTVTVSGTVITSTTYTTITTTITTTVESVVTRTATTTVTTTTVVTVAVSAPVSAPPLATEIAQQTLQQVIESERAELVKEIDDLINQLNSRKASMVPKDALEARALANLDADINMLKQIRDSALKAETPDELKSLRQEFESIRSKYSSLLPQASIATQTPLQASVKLPPLPEPLRQAIEQIIGGKGEKVDAKLVASQLANAYTTFAQQVKDENLRKALQQVADVYSYLAKSDPSTILRDATLFYMLMDLSKDDVHKQVYESRRESFQSLLRILAGSATSSDVEKAFEALAIIKQLKDQGMLDEGRVLDNYKYALIAGKTSLSGLLTSVAPGLGLVQAIQALWQTYSGEVDKEVRQRLEELESQISGGVEPEKRKLPIQLIADATALIDPTRYIYSSAFNGVKSLAKALGADDNTANSIADKVASGVTGASTTVAGVLIPPLGIAMGLSAVLDTVSDIASRLSSPIDKQLLLSYIQNYWQDLIVDTAIGAASGLAAGYATAMLKPLIYNKVADALERLGAKDLANRIRLSVGVPAEGGRGVIEATVREVPEEVSIEHSYDPVSHRMTLKINLGGKTEIISVDIPEELANEFKGYAKSVEHGVEAPEGAEIARDFEAVFKLMYKTVKDRDKALQMFKDFANRVGLGDDVAVQTLLEAAKTDVVGNAKLKVWSRSSTVYDDARGLCRYIEKGGKAWQIVGASDEASSLIRGFIMYDDEAAMRMLVSNQAYLYPKTGEGRYLNNVILEKYVPSEDVYLAIVEDLKKLFNAVKANIEFLKQFREHPESGGLSSERVAQLLRVELGPDTTSALRSDPVFRTYVEGAIMNILKGVDVYPVIVYDPATSFMRASLLIPAAVASTALQSIVERGVMPANLRIMPINSQVIENVVATRTVETAFSITRTIFTNVAETTRLSEQAINRIVTEPALLTRTVDVISTKTVTQPTALTQQVTLSEQAVHRTDTVPALITRTIDVMVTKIDTKPTALTQQASLIETSLHRTATQSTAVVTTITKTSVVTTSVVVPVTGTGSLSIVTIFMTITYTNAIPVTLTGATPAPAPPPTPPETGTGTVVSTPTLPRLPGVELLALAPTTAKPEKKPELEKEVLVI